MVLSTRIKPFLFKMGYNGVIMNLIALLFDFMSDISLNS
jgi:hypothetical protein